MKAKNQVSQAASTSSGKLPQLGLAVCAGALALGVADALAQTPATAQSSTSATDALINKLIEKGILSTKEAGELKREADHDLNRASATKISMPDWVTSLKFSGDFRGRYDGIYIDNPQGIDRNRFRYRLRLGATLVMKDDFEVGLRLATADASGTFGGNPISANSTFQDNGSKKGIYIDLAYAKWTPLHDAEWTGTFTVGKMLSPFTFTDMVFDYDYTPEGVAAQFAYKLNANHAVKFNAAGFVLDELSGSSRDVYLGAVQSRFESEWSKKLQTSFGVGLLGIKNSRNLLNGAVPNVNRGNTRDTNGAPVVSFNPIVADAWLTYKLDRVPGYAGEFPIKVGGEYLNNLASRTKNQGVSGGVTFGKAGKKGQWELTYNYRYWGADMWFEEFVDDDFGAFYQSSAGLNSGTTAASEYGGGTNVKGHVIKAAYSLYDSLTLSLVWYHTQLIDQYPAGSNTGTDRILLDLMWKF